jgi:acyl-CoA thioester hydrolase
MAVQDPAFEWLVRVYYEDTDAGGVVYHARYLHFMERARTEWLRALGFEQQRLRDEQGVLFAVRKMTLDFVRPARFDQALRVTAAVSGAGRASIDFAQQVLNAEDGAVYCRAAVNVACLDAERLRPMRIPGAIRDALGSNDAPALKGDSVHGL